MLNCIQQGQEKVDICVESDSTKAQRDRRYENPQRRVPMNSSEVQLDMRISFSVNNAGVHGNPKWIKKVWALLW